MNLNGFSVRPVTVDDAAAITAMLNLCGMADVGAQVANEEDTRTDLETPDFNPATDTLGIFTPGGDMAAYGEFWNLTEPRVRPYFFARVHPNYRSQGLGTYMLEWAAQRSESVVADAPEGVRVSLRSGTASQNEGAQQLLQNAGFSHIRTFYRMKIEMDAPPPAPQWPDGITVRTVEYTRDDIHHAYVANEDAFTDHWGHMPVGFDKWWHWVENDPNFDPTLWFLAMDGDEIAATCFCRPNSNEDPAMGWVSDLGVRRAWRRRGLGLALLHHCFGEFWRRGQRKVGLGVDASSLTGATRLYERAGMHVYRQFMTFERELQPGTELSTQTLE